MNQKELAFLERKLEKISIEAWNVKHLAIILEELLCNDNGNLSSSDICTLSEILTRTAAALSAQMVKLQQKLGI